MIRGQGECGSILRRPFRNLWF